MVAAGLSRMQIICTAYFLCGIMDTLASCLRGRGYSVIPMIVSLVGSCLLRLVWIATIFRMFRSTGTLYISYRWARSSWLEKNADSTLLRGIALRAGQNTQERLFRCTADAPCAEAVSLATGAWEQTFTGLAQDSCAAVCPVESKVYFGAAGADSLLAANR